MIVKLHHPLSAVNTLLRYRFGSFSVYREELYPANSMILDSFSGTSKISIALLLCAVVIVKYRDKFSPVHNPDKPEPKSLLFTAEYAEYAESFLFFILL